MSSIISHVVTNAEKLVSSSLVLYAFATEIFGVDRALFSEETQAFYGEFNTELSEVIGEVRKLLEGKESELYNTRAIKEEVHCLLDFP